MKLLLLLELLIILFICIRIVPRNDEVVHYDGPIGVAPLIVKHAHAYHGILDSIWDKELNQLVFYRDGKRCKLLAYLRKKKHK